MGHSICGYHTTSEPNISTEFINAIQPNATNQMNNMLIKDFNAGEVKKALDQMYPLKSPGIDSMPPSFTNIFGLLWVIVWLNMLLTS